MRPAAFYSLLTFDRGFSTRGRRLVGVDEAGRGPLAGPVTAAAVAFDLSREGWEDLAEINDSKTLEPATRERLAPLIRRRALACAVARAEVEEIDRLNILRATHLAMARALEAIAEPGDFVLVDGRPVPGLAPNLEAIVDGDAQSLSIAAAGILAKVERDRIMSAEHGRFPDYGFDQHKGYGTPRHRLALEVFGACALHRRSFAPVAEHLRPRRPAPCFCHARAALEAAGDEAAWLAAVEQIHSTLGFLTLSEGRLLGLLAEQTGKSLELPGRRMREVVGPFQPAFAPLFSLEEAK
ncbi:ribonuclease HII [bacterium]|nr:ribonuclease HII [bacterium]